MSKIPSPWAFDLQKAFALAVIRKQKWREQDPYSLSWGTPNPFYEAVIPVDDCEREAHDRALAVKRALDQFGVKDVVVRGPYIQDVGEDPSEGSVEIFIVRCDKYSFRDELRGIIAHDHTDPREIIERDIAHRRRKAL